MYVDTSTIKTQGKTYTRHLLRESYRDGPKVRHRTIANLSHCSEAEIEAIRLALRHKHELEHLGTLQDHVTFKQGPSLGAVWVIYQVARRLGIERALGTDREGKLALWQVMARVIDQGSRLSAVRLATSHAACDVLGLQSFNEDDLYANLDWIARQQGTVEERLFRSQKKPNPAGLFLYDVTSSYFEGTDNALAAFGYNRDGKKGKRQIVIGLLCDEEGDPVSIEVFPGNTQDPKTVASQVEKVKTRLGVREVTFVGDRGMIKSAQIEDLARSGFHYITAITQPQIEKLLKADTFQMTLFDQTLAEVMPKEGLRYVLRRNPVRAEEVSASREAKRAKLQADVAQQNHYLTGHPRAQAARALQKMIARAAKLRIAGWIVLALEGRTITLTVNEEARKDIAKLDGCYVLKTDLSAQHASKEIIHDRYKDLASVERAFRSSKTAHLEMRPIYLRLEERTRGHAFVVMLAYKIVRHLAACWSAFDLTVEEGLHALTTLCVLEVTSKNTPPYLKIPTPCDIVADLLRAADCPLPKAFASSGVKVSTRKKLPSERFAQ